MSGVGDGQFQNPDLRNVRTRLGQREYETLKKKVKA